MVICIPMKKEVYIRQFVAGFFIPAAFLSLLLAILSARELSYIIDSWDILIAPFFYGLYSIFYFKIKDWYPITNPRIRYGVHGAVLWVIIALGYLLITLTPFHPHQGMVQLFGVRGDLIWHATAVLYWPLIGYVWFAYLQKPLCEILGLKV